jgi:hypothetical protein
MAASLSLRGYLFLLEVCFSQVGCYFLLNSNLGVINFKFLRSSVEFETFEVGLGLKVQIKGAVVVAILVKSAAPTPSKSSTTLAT